MKWNDEDELKVLKKKMIGTEKFAEKIPVFRQFIMDNKLDGTEDWVKFANSYKKIFFSWGLHRARFESGTIRTITNYEGKHDIYLFSVYINTLNLFNSHEKFGLEKILEKSNVFFFDKLNTTFYVEDEHIEGFLEALNDWYIEAIARLGQHKKEEEINDGLDSIENEYLYFDDEEQTGGTERREREGGKMTQKEIQEEFEKQGLGDDYSVHFYKYLQEMLELEEIELDVEAVHSAFTEYSVDGDTGYCFGNYTDRFLLTEYVDMERIEEDNFPLDKYRDEVFGLIERANHFVTPWENILVIEPGAKEPYKYWDI